MNLQREDDPGPHELATGTNDDGVTVEQSPATPFPLVDTLPPELRKHHHNGLVQILQNAYSGELAAAYAYRGHWKSVKNEEQRKHIRIIEEEEWEHRYRVGVMLATLGAAPVPFKERKLWVIGRTIGLGCHLIGWFLPMYFAGRLESGNVGEYEDAAVHATALGLTEYAESLTDMARVELEHEIYFRNVIEGHRLLPVMKRFFGWS